MKLSIVAQLPEQCLSISDSFRITIHTAIAMVGAYSERMNVLKRDRYGSSQQRVSRGWKGVCWGNLT